MPVTFSSVDSDTDFQIATVMQKHHQALTDAGVELTVLFAYGPKDQDGETTGKAIKVNGYPALACIKINSLRDRVGGLKDATLIIDGDCWPTTPDPRKLAIIDHELCHLEIKPDEDGTIQVDDCGRPKLKMRLHDFHFGGFAEVADRHKEESVEVAAVKHIGAIAVRQAWLPGF